MFPTTSSRETLGKTKHNLSYRKPTACRKFGNEFRSLKFLSFEFSAKELEQMKMC